MVLPVMLGSGSVAGGLVLLGWSVFGARRPRRRPPARGLLDGLNLGPADLRAAALQHSVGQRVVRPGVAALAQRGRRLTPAGMVRSLERRIALAGAGGVWPIERVLAAKVVLAATGLLLGILVLGGNPSGATFALAVAFTAMGYAAPDALLYNASVKRQEAIQRELADTLDQITITVEAGLGFEASVDRIVHTGDSPLKSELNRLLREVQFGVPRPQALQNLLARTDVRDLRNFVHAVSQAETYGIPIAQVLRVQSSELRDKRRQAAEERAMKVPVKIVMPLMLCILPSLFIVLLGPAVLRISHSGFVS